MWNLRVELKFIIDRKTFTTTNIDYNRKEDGKKFYYLLCLVFLLNNMQCTKTWHSESAGLFWIFIWTKIMKSFKNFKKKNGNQNIGTMLVHIPGFFLFFFHMYTNVYNTFKIYDTTLLKFSRPKRCKNTKL